MLLKRLLLSKNVEVYEVKEQLYSDTKYYLIFLDYRRQSKFEDFSDIPGYSKDNFESRDNYIMALALYNNSINDDEKESLYEIASGFLEDKDNCNWNIKYQNADFKYLQNIRVNRKDLITKIQQIILSNGFGNSDLLKINVDSFKNLFQE